MLCTLVIVIGTFPYTLSAVAIPWSLDQDMENLKIGTRLINERFASVMGECVIFVLI